MTLRRAAQRRPGYQELVSPSDMEFISFGTISLEAGACYAGGCRRRESGLILLEGRCEIAAGGVKRELVRKDVFSDKAGAFYVPAGTPYDISASSSCLLAACGAPAEARGAPVCVGPEAVRVRDMGRGNCARKVHDVIGPDTPAERLLVGETFTPPGNWSSVPPHKHDREDPPHEARMEELYYFRILPVEGFALQRVFSEDGSRDEALAVKDGDVVMIPGGYHPVVALPGCEVYYLWVLAGERRTPRSRPHPRLRPS